MWGESHHQNPTNKNFDKKKMESAPIVEQMTWINTWHKHSPLTKMLFWKKSLNQITNPLWVEKFVSYFTIMCQSKNCRSKEQSHQTISTHNDGPPSSTHNDDPPQLAASLSKLHQRANWRMMNQSKISWIWKFP